MRSSSSVSGGESDDDSVSVVSRDGSDGASFVGGGGGDGEHSDVEVEMGFAEMSDTVVDEDEDDDDGEGYMHNEYDEIEEDSDEY